MTRLLAFDLSDLIYPIALLIMAAASGLQHMLKKKNEPDRGEDKVIIVPPRRQNKPAARPSPPPSARQGQPAAPVRRTPPRRPAAGPSAKPQIPRPVIKFQPKPKRQPEAAAPSAQPARPAKASRETPIQHAQDVADHAEHVANKLREEQLVKAGQLKPGVHLHGPKKQQKRARLPGIGELQPGSMKQAVLLSEILRPPIALREQGHRSDL